MSDGREEQWEKRELDRPDWVSRLVVSANKGRDGCEVTLPTWIVDAILVARAQAGLAQRAEEWVVGHLDRCNKTMAWHPDKTPCTCGYEELRRDYATLTAGPTAAAE